MERTSSMSFKRSTSSFSTLQESISAPEASSTQAQWNSLPASMPAQTLPMTTSSARLPALALRDPADGSLHSDFSLISISGQVLLIKGRGAILLEPSLAAELQKPSSAPRASSKIHARLDDKENGREAFSEVQLRASANRGRASICKAGT